eukprot:CAMPEP_0204254304 /NCGR_PEP_ID=MMETSP0468-20130131/2466_1 /ASSEMBLY_ACC=CAM_ASM_000383 /TAXON_ID=2969 /ORGANISM="Oxyrrhis marina" /LENGTH=384 /DNA_ID=CAMNT_0051228031 /DNA_START=28 /DNA_END=1182 /DNA_ORIENTATION=-
MEEKCYDILEVSKDASQDEIKKAYKRACLKYHPDKGGDAETFKKVTQAFDTLGDEGKRSAYDRALIRTRSTDGQKRRAEGAAERRHASAAPPARPAAAAGNAEKRQSSAGPAGPRAGAYVEIPSDPSALSAKELKELLTSLGVRHDDCLEKADLLARLRERKQPDRRPSNAAPPPAASGAPSGATPRRTQSTTNVGDLRIKLISMGKATCGKSCLIKRFCEGRFVNRYISTIGVDYGVKPVNVRGTNAKVNFFDIAGDDDYVEIRKNFYSNANGVLLVYDITSSSSFRQLENWIDEARANGCSLSSQHKKEGEPPFVALLANKHDLANNRAVTAEDGAAFARRHGMKFFETSSQTGQGVNEAMTWVFESVVDWTAARKAALGIP